MLSIMSTHALFLIIFLILLLALSVTADFSAIKSSLLNDLTGTGTENELEAILTATLKRLKNPVVELENSAVIIGGGLSGLTAALYLLENDANVILLDRAAFLGGNSAKASSGINGAYTRYQASSNLPDSPSNFHADSLKSSNRTADSFTGGLIERMVGESGDAVEWIIDRANVAKPILVGQMGGHSSKRTHRPESGLAGAAFINGLEKAVQKYLASGQLQLLTDSRVTNLSPAAAKGSWTVEVNDGEKTIAVPSVIICTGGFAFPSATSILSKVAPELTNLGSTNAPTTTGDGITLAIAVGAGTIDMDHVQVHPTGFSDVPAGFKEVEGEKRSLILCAEIVRGSGGILLDGRGERFVDELETRKFITNAMNERAKAQGQEKVEFVIAVPPSAQAAVEAHINIYGGKGLLIPVDGVAGVEKFVKDRLSGDQVNVAETFRKERAGSGVSRRTTTNLTDEGTYYVGVVQPVLHYTMGGLKVNKEGRVLGEDDKEIGGLFAAGEVMGGVHGENRLGGSSLLDCVVFGLGAAKSVLQEIKTVNEVGVQAKLAAASVVQEAAAVPAAERKQVVISGKTYDVTDFLAIHPGGSIDVAQGEDLTARFVHAHGQDFSLLDRGSIQEIGDGGVEVVREKKFYEDYGGTDGSWREFMGRRAWFVLHSFAAKYPDSPTEADKRAMRNFIAAFGQLYPCKLCRGHLQQQLRDESLGPPNVESRQELSVWVCELHNIVNVDLGKEQVECTAFGIDMMYLKDCGECEPVKKDVEVNVFEGGSGGYDSFYAGPWDSDIYGRGDGLLNTVVDSNDAWETGDLAELVDSMDVLRKWFRVFSKKEVMGVREEMKKGKESRELVRKKVQDVLGGALEGMQKGQLKEYEELWKLKLKDEKQKKK